MSQANRPRKANIKRNNRKGRAVATPNRSRQQGRTETENFRLGRRLAPPSVVLDLPFSMTNVVTTASASQSVSFHVNGAYDVDPQIGSRFTLGFPEWMNFYNYYRVEHVVVTVQFTNMNITPMTVLCFFTNSAPSISGVGARDLADGPMGRKVFLGPYTGGKDTKSVIMRQAMRHVIGDKLYTTSERYVGSSGTNPTDLVYFSFYPSMAVGTNVDGLVYDVTCHFRVTLFDLKNFADNAANESILPAPTGNGQQVPPRLARPNLQQKRN